MSEREGGSDEETNSAIEKDVGLMKKLILHLKV
jgi:hypothetical protein